MHEETFLPRWAGEVSPFGDGGGRHVPASPTHAQREWARCRHWIAAALEQAPGFETIADVERRIARGEYQFWPGAHAAAITEVAQFDQRKVLIVRHAGGDLAELIDQMEPGFCSFARAQGCDGIMGEGRAGWRRACERRGYRFAYLAMIKDLPASRRSAEHEDA